MIGWRICNFAEKFIFEESACNGCQIICAGIMIFIIQAICIYKVGILTAKFFCTCIHHFGKIFDITAYMLCNCIGGFVGGTDHNAVETFFERQRLPGIHTHI